MNPFLKKIRRKFLFEYVQEKFSKKHLEDFNKKTEDILGQVSK